ncbi:hypothetical protein [Roseateles sp. P5_E8]
MLLDLNDPTSIVAWWRVWPERHGEFLMHKLRSSPQFAPGIREAQRLIATNPELKTIREESLRARRAREAREAELVSDKSSLELRWQELAAAA